MSLAGVRSNRGDAYQTFIALRWAVSMIGNPRITAIEVDSTLLDAQGSPEQVDDIVVHWGTGDRTFCQCKKNEPDFKAWTAATLATEIGKAARLLSTNARALVAFYSGSPFGELGKLREYALSQSETDAYLQGLSAELRPVHDQLLRLLQDATGTADVFSFLARTSFLTVAFDAQAEADILSQLASTVSAADRAYAALWTAIDRVGARLGRWTTSATTHRLDRQQALQVVESAGSVVTPTRAQSDIEKSLGKLSLVGHSWRRDIRGVRLTRAGSAAIVAEVHRGARSLLVAAGPGVGKTCTLLDAFEALSTATGVIPVFVQCRSFAGAASPDERSALGYPSDFVGAVARLAENSRVAVCFDSLDVLSLSRDHHALTFFLSQIDQLLAASNVCVIAACRTFDAKYDARLAVRNWDTILHLQDLDWAKDVEPLLHAWGVRLDVLTPATRELLKNPRNLAVFADMFLRGVTSAGTTQQDLTREYLSVCVRDEPALGEHAMQALERMAEHMLKQRSLQVSRARADVPLPVEKALRSAGVIQGTDSGTLEFSHQTLFDVLSINAWERRGGTLHSFIASVVPVPFVRPAIRAYVLYLAGADRKGLRNQVRAIMDGPAPHHIKRALVEALADVEPTDGDWPMLEHLRQHTSLFDALFFRTTGVAWYRFWLKFLVPACVAHQDASRLGSIAYRASEYLQEDAASVLTLWETVLAAEWTEKAHFAIRIGFRLSEYDGPPIPGLEALLDQLVRLPRPDHDSLGGAVLRSVRIGAASDDLLWRYITGAVDDEDLRRFRVGDKIKCDPHIFGEKEALADRMRSSDRLLDLAIDSIERWHSVVAQRYPSGTRWMTGFLRATSFMHAHSKHDFNHVTAEEVLFRAIEAGILDRAMQGTSWWTRNAARLAGSDEGALRYWAVKALTLNPCLDTALAADLASDGGMLGYPLQHEMGDLVHATLFFMPEEQLGRVCSAIETKIATSERDDHVLLQNAQLVRAVPASFRSVLMQQTLDEAERRWGFVIRQPHIETAGGTVRAPFVYERFLDASNVSLLHLLEHYDRSDAHTRDWGELIGGSDQVAHQLEEAASRAPERFVRILAESWGRVPDMFKDALLGGVLRYLRHLHGPLQPNEHWIPRQKPDAPAVAEEILAELERHPAYWGGRRVAASALLAISPVVELSEANRFAFQVLGFLTAEAPEGVRDLLTTAINSARGNAAEAALDVFTRLVEGNLRVPPLLMTAVRQFACDSSEAVRAVMLRHLPYLTSKSREHGWELFRLCTADASPALWNAAEPCLYYAYHQQFDIVRGALERILAAAGTQEGEEDDDDDNSSLATWGRISALASLSGHIPFTTLIVKLSSLECKQSWQGATSVWIANANLNEHRQACLEGLALALESPSAAALTGTAMESLFDAEMAPEGLAPGLLRRMFAALRLSASKTRHYHPHGFLAWAAAAAKTDPELALSGLEELASFLFDEGQSVYDHREDIPRALTELFREAEERELGDEGRLLRRVIEVQDRLLAIGVHGIQEWLAAAERP